MFVLEASEYLYEAKVHKSIFSCIAALSDQDVEIGVVLFNQDSIMFVNPSSMEVTKVKLVEGRQTLE